MGDYNFYGGSKYGLDYSTHNNSYLGFDYKVPVSAIGVTTDPRTANQIKAVADKLNTGAKTIEVTGITPEVLEYIPDQHLDELNKLRKLVKVDLTLHGPLIEPTGVTKQGWDETQRQQAERHMWSALERAHKINPDGNIVVTFHSSNGLPEPETTVIDPKTGKPTSTEMFIVDERDGRFTTIKPKENFLLDKKVNVNEQLKELNQEEWTKALSGVSFHAHQGKSSIVKGLADVRRSRGGEDVLDEDKKGFLEIYKLSGTEEGQKLIEKQFPGDERAVVEQRIADINYGDIYVRDAYNSLQELYNKAYTAVEKDGKAEDKAKLEAYQQELRSKIKSGEIKFDDPTKLPEFADEVMKGVKILSTLTEAPKLHRPLREFAVDKASETFANLALKAYDKFEAKDKTAPIISIENPPAGSGLARAEDLRDVIKEARSKFVDKAVEEKGLSREEAQKTAEKLIGATWDVGHINMLKKYGYENKDIIKQTETVAPYVKHIHLSDNFGMEHTELPMGMGNVPIKQHMEKLQAQFKDKLKDIKQIVETGGWYQHFKSTPLPETLAAFGSPIYAMKMAPYWSQRTGLSGGYFGGYGQMLPEGNFSMYGAGFSGLPQELGGQMGGRNRLSGAPME